MVVASLPKIRVAQSVPYLSSGQELGETRIAMTKTLMKDIEGIVNKQKHLDHKYYILVHGKPFPYNSQMIKMKLLVMNQKPSMMLSCMLFEVDNKESTLKLLWVLPGSWPTWACEGKNEPISETVASLKDLGKVCDLDKVIAY